MCTVRSRCLIWGTPKDARKNLRQEIWSSVWYQNTLTLKCKEVMLKPELWRHQIQTCNYYLDE
jgi:hypothetical protein